MLNPQTNLLRHTHMTPCIHIDIIKLINLSKHKNKQKLTEKSFGINTILWERSIWYISRAECPTARTTPSYPNFWPLNRNLSLESETLTPTTCPSSTSRSSTLVPNLIVTLKKKNILIVKSEISSSNPKETQYIYTSICVC